RGRVFPARCLDVSESRNTTWSRRPAARTPARAGRGEDRCTAPVAAGADPASGAGHHETRSPTGPPTVLAGPRTARAVDNRRLRLRGEGDGDTPGGRAPGAPPPPRRAPRPPPGPAAALPPPAAPAPPADGSSAAHHR